MIANAPPLLQCTIFDLHPCIDRENLEALLTKILRRPVKIENGCASLYVGSADVAETIAYRVHNILARNIDLSSHHGPNQDFYKIGVKHVE